MKLLARVLALFALVFATAALAANPSSVPSVGSVSNLRVIPNYQGFPLPEILVQGIGFFTWSSGSSCTDDGVSCVNPTGNGGNGRWVRDAGAPGYPQAIPSSAYATLALADSAASGAGKSLLIDRNWTVSSPTTLASNVIFNCTGIITHSTNTLTFSGTVTAPDCPIFDTATSSSGVVTFSINPAFYYPEWWGADPTCTNDSVYPLNAFFAVLTVSTPVYTKGVMRGCYVVTATQALLSGNGGHWAVDAHGARIRRSGANWGLVVRNVSTVGYGEVDGLTIDDQGSWAASALGGFNFHGAINTRCDRCQVLAFSNTVPASSYIAYKIDAIVDGTTDSYWAELLDSGYIPTDLVGSTLIKACVEIDNQSNAVRIVGGSYFTCSKGVSINAEGGSPNGVVIRDVAVQSFQDCFYVTNTSGTGYLQGLRIIGNRCEDDNVHAGSLFFHYVAGTGTTNPTTLWSQPVFMGNYIVGTGAATAPANWQGNFLDTRVTTPAGSDAGALEAIQSFGSSGTTGTNLQGNVTISGTNTTGTITLANTEPDANYSAICTPAIASGSPAVGSVQVGTVTTTTIPITLSTAPGGGTSVKVTCLLMR